VADKHSATLLGAGAIMVTAGGVFMAVTAAEPSKKPSSVWGNTWFDVGFGGLILGLLIAAVGIYHHFRSERKKQDVPAARKDPKISRRRLALGLIGACAILITAAGVLKIRPAPHPGPCTPGRGPADGRTVVMTRNGECVGYSDSSAFIFKNPPAVDEGHAQQRLQDERMQYDEEQIFQQNADVGDEQGPNRPVVELVYFAGLTAARGDDYDPGQAEELEGLLIAQKLALQADSGPLLKVIVANGGSEMQDAVSVAGRLISLFAADRHLLGVVGFDRSTRAVKQAINMFDAHHIPMVATTLSADRIGHGDSYYFQLPPANYQEAHLILEYIQHVVPLYFRQPHHIYNSQHKIRPTGIKIYWPSPDPADLYITSLVRDLKREVRRFRGLPAPAITHRFAGLCGASKVDIYAGRQDWPRGSPNDTFGQFLLTLATGCAGNEPFVIADDAVTRFIVDPAQLSQQELGALAVSYVSQGIAILRTGNHCLSTQRAARFTHATTAMREFCQQYATIVSALSRLPAQRGQRITLHWTGERVGLAYDAAELFVSAAINYQNSNGRPINRSNVRGQFEASPYPGVTGTVDFRTSHIGVNLPAKMPLAIVRIQLSSPAAAPACAYSYSASGVQQFGLMPARDSCPPGFG
jgi:hypothetical protein